MAAEGWPNPGPRWIPHPHRFWRWRAVINGWLDGQRGIGLTAVDITPADADRRLGRVLEAIDAEPYRGPSNSYEVPPFVSRFLQVVNWKVGIEGQQFIATNELYADQMEVELARICEAERRMARAQQDLDQARHEPVPKGRDVEDARKRAEDAVVVQDGRAEDLEPIDVEDLAAVFRGRAGNRAQRAVESENESLRGEHRARIEVAEAELKNWLDQRHAAEQQYVQASTSQAEWFQFMKARCDALIGWGRMINDLYWATNRRVRRSLWRRIAQTLFGRWAKRPFVLDPLTVSPTIETPAWIAQYSHLDERKPPDFARLCSERGGPDQPLGASAESSSEPDSELVLDTAERT